jgi:hypothetical protein
MTTSTASSPPAGAGTADQPVDPVDQWVWIAIGLGWQMAELYAESASVVAVAGPNPPGLPGMSGLSLSELLHLRLNQVRAGVIRLSGAFDAAGIDTGPLNARIAAAEDEVNSAGGSSSLRPRVLGLHVSLFGALTAARPRVGKAFGLGRALADLCLRPQHSTKADFEDNFQAGRLVTVRGWLMDLKSSLPDHAAEAIASSLQLWARWVDKTEDTDPIWRAPASWQDPVHPATTTSIATATLYTQGARWRAVVTGERAATDTLSAEDIVKAGDALLQRLLALFSQFFRRYWRIAVMGILGITVVVALVVWLSGGLAAGLTGIAAVAGAFGLTWQGARTTLGSAISKAEEPLWGAQLDLAVASALTKLPDESVSFDVPIAGWKDTAGVRSVDPPSVELA